ncbi:HalOD1 output domain-containing protein [Haladaptatus pallidirubidus]|uniref:Halobacterial output domain-containing protein n=1 Tax=Haladaptatus pallidirubidus TaxID=1008152 RepID=A0AAV3UIN2_9EURY|nr:HalOD1 output domain-containing protein [Haladaptatus pallidirubidus]
MGQPDETELYYPHEDRSLSQAALSALDETHETALRDADFTLYDHIDPDALDSLFQADADAPITVTFAVEEYDVTIWGDVGIHIHVQDDGEDAPGRDET